MGPIIVKLDTELGSPLLHPLCTFTHGNGRVVLLVFGLRVVEDWDCDEEVARFDLYSTLDSLYYAAGVA